MSPLKANRLGAAVRGLAVVLATGLLLLELLGANSQFHQAFHSSDQPASSTCLLCLFAKGQVDLPESVTPVTAVVGPALNPAPRIEPLVLLHFTRLAFPSRAPPLRASLPPVVA